MSAISQSVLLLAALILAAAIATSVFHRLLSTDPQEPPSEASIIPFVGHLLGLMTKKYEYYVDLSRKSGKPIFTVDVMWSRIYIVTAPELCQAVQKQHRTLAFPPIEAKFALRLFDNSKKAHDTLLNNVNGDLGDWGVTMEAYPAMHHVLKPGNALDDMNRIMLSNINSDLQKMEESIDKKGPNTIQLFAWLKEFVSAASTNSAWGPQNPFQDKAIVDAFWKFESQLVGILFGVAPSITARQAIKARARCTKAFVRYFENGGHHQASLMTRVRAEVHQKYKIPLDDMAKWEVGQALAVLVNTTPAIFWILSLVYADPALLKEIREEISDVVERSRDEHGHALAKLDMTALKESCPLLTSTYREVLRYRSVGVSVRQVMEDHKLDGRWLLKKGAMIQMPSRVLHTDPALYGEDASDFDPRRFIKSADGSKHVPKATYFRGFGGGKTLCPGRHFATNEVLAVASMIFMRFDLSPLKSGGNWEVPTCWRTNLASVVMEPDKDIDVEISRRRGFESVKWSFSLSNSTKAFAVAAEDLE